MKTGGPISRISSGLRVVQCRRMVTQVVIDKAGDKVVAMVVARLQTQGQRMPRRLGGALQCLGLELSLEKVVAVALVDQDRQLLRRLRQQDAGIPLTPARTLLAQVAGKGLLAPGAVHRVADRREGRQRLIAPRVAQGADQRTMTPHGVTADTAF